MWAPYVVKLDVLEVLQGDHGVEELGQQVQIGQSHLNATHVLSGSGTNHLVKVVQLCLYGSSRLDSWIRPYS